MADLAALDAELNRMIAGGKALDAFERFYHDDAVMEEPTGEPPRVGKEACRRAEREFYESMEDFQPPKLLGSAVGDGVTYSEWLYDFKLKGQPRVQLQEVARRRWRDGRVVDERFYYHRGG